MFVNLGPGFSYSSILITGPLMMWCSLYSCSCSKALETPNGLFLAWCHEQSTLKYSPVTLYIYNNLFWQYMFKNNENITFCTKPPVKNYFPFDLPHNLYPNPTLLGL